MNPYLSKEESEKMYADSYLCDELDLIREQFRQFDDNFFMTISECVSAYKNISDEAEKAKREKQCIDVAKNLFLESCTEEDEVKLFISIYVLKLLGRSYSYLVSKKLSEKMKDKLIELIKKLDLKINVHSNAPYNETKYYESFNDAKKCGNYISLSNLMDDLIIHSGVFHKLESSWSVLIDFLCYLDKYIIIDVLKQTNEYEKIEWILYFTDKTVFENPCFLSSLGNHYLVIRCAKYWMQYLDGKYTIDSVQNMPDYTNIFERLFSKKDLNLRGCIEGLKLQFSQSYNYIMGCLLKIHPEFADIYLEHADLSKKSTEFFSLGYLSTNKINNHKQCYDLIEKIKSNFFIKEVKSFTPVNSYTGYLNLFINYNSERIRSEEEFYNVIRDYTQKILLVQNSWNYDSIRSLWIEFFYFCLSNKVIKIKISMENLKKLAPLLFDKRNEILLDDETEVLSVMRELLVNPDNCKKVTIRDLNGKYDINFDRS